MPDIAHMIGPVAVTLLYVLVYYALIMNVLRLKITLAREYAARGEKFDRYLGHDRRMLAADRMQLNVLEHMGPFLVLLWLNAVYVGALGATVAGAIYVVTRIYYPLAMGGRLGRGIRSAVYLSTAPGYAVLIYLAGGLVVALLR